MNAKILIKQMNQFSLITWKMAYCKEMVILKVFIQMRGIAKTAALLTANYVHLTKTSVASLTVSNVTKPLVARPPSHNQMKVH